MSGPGVDPAGRRRAEAECPVCARYGGANASTCSAYVREQQKRSRASRVLRAVRSSPALVGAFVNLGQLYISTGDDQRALRAFDAAAALAPEHPEANYHLAAIREGRREFARALEHLEKIPGERRGLEHLQLAVRCLLGLGRADEAAGLVAPLRSAQSAAAVPAEDAAASPHSSPRTPVPTWPWKFWRPRACARPAPSPSSTPRRDTLAEERA